MASPQFINRLQLSVRKHQLIIILLLIQILVGIFTFQEYGLSWDEPYFYDYANQVPIAYSSEAWFNPHFDFNQIYGVSAEDHKFYGPAYLLLARPIQQLIQLSGADFASAWHLVNFFCFTLGILIFYLFCIRWLSPSASFAASVFLSVQPLLFGHAFINPKDIPFMVFFMASVFSGIRVVDLLNTENGKTPWGNLLVASIVLGLTAAIRVIGPLAGILVILYALPNLNKKQLAPFVVYAITAMLVMFIFWPYLWQNPLDRLFEVLRHMSNNPTELGVLFAGQVFRANQMPGSYFPTMLALTLTEPTWIFIMAGWLRLAWLARGNLINQKLLVIFSLWFGLLFFYIVLSRPAVYDGIRHFLFILPPLFVFVGFAFEWLLNKLPRFFFGGILLACLLPGLIGIWSLFPYPYAYYNQFTGGTQGAYHVYETDYWLTCYKEAITWLRNNRPAATIYIQREFEVANYYADGLTILPLSGQETFNAGDLILFSTRANLDKRSTLRGLPTLKSFGREGAVFCLIKEYVKP